MPKVFASKDKKLASNMLLAGVPPKDVASTFGVHVSSIYALRKDMGHGHTKPQRASHVVTLRLSDEEFQALNTFVADTGMASKNAAMRSLIRSATGFLELKRGDFLDLSELRRELKAQGTNLNQISYALNKSAFNGGAKIGKDETAFLKSLRVAYASIDAVVSSAFREVRQKGRDALHTADRL
jgi:hypothetical protein